MTERVVDLLELVDIDDHHCAAINASIGVADRFAQLAKQLGAIEHAGQRIEACRMAQRRFLPMLLDRELQNLVYALSNTELEVQLGHFENLPVLHKPILTEIRKTPLKMVPAYTPVFSKESIL